MLTYTEFQAASAPFPDFATVDEATFDAMLTLVCGSIPPLSISEKQLNALQLQGVFCWLSKRPAGGGASAEDCNSCDMGGVKSLTTPDGERIEYFENTATDFCACFEASLKKACEVKATPQSTNRQRRARALVVNRPYEFDDCKPRKRPNCGNYG